MTHATPVRWLLQTARFTAALLHRGPGKFRSARCIVPGGIRIQRAMTTSEIATQFVDMCREGKNLDVMQLLYDEDIVSVEATRRDTGSYETAGKAAVIQKSVEWAGAHEIHGGTVDGPFILIDKFAVVFEFQVTPKATGERVTVREIAVYTVKDNLITREEFFYGDGSDALAR